jgi:hypothetical protein
MNGPTEPPGVMAGGASDDENGSKKEQPRNELHAKVKEIMEEREMTEAAALFVVENEKCDVCRCQLGVAVTEDTCMCSCHCRCCCAPYFKCQNDCNCHYEPAASEQSDDSEETNSRGEEADDSSNMNGLNENDLNDVIIDQTPESQVNEENAKKDEENADQLGANSTDSTAQSNHDDTAQANGQAAHGVTVGERGEDEGEQEPAPKSAPDQHVRTATTMRT